MLSISYQSITMLSQSCSRGCSLPGSPVQLQFTVPKRCDSCPPESLPPLVAPSRAPFLTQPAHPRLSLTRASPVNQSHRLSFAECVRMYTERRQLRKRIDELEDKMSYLVWQNTEMRRLGILVLPATGCLLQQPECPTLSIPPPQHMGMRDKKQVAVLTTVSTSTLDNI